MSETLMALSPEEKAELPAVNRKLRHEAALPAVNRKLRHEAADALGLPRQTRFVTCAIHGQRGRLEEVYAMNNVCREEGGAITCEPDHPFCFGWASPDLQNGTDDSWALRKGLYA